MISQAGVGAVARAAGREGVAPVAALLVLSPVIGEVLSGATRLSFIFVLVSEIMVWGCGALLIREAVRRWKGGWTSVLLLGFGLAIAEEFIIQQTSIAPLPFVPPPGYGRLWGVNWPYFVFMLGYEAIWIVVVPIQVTEMIFPERRDQPWLSPRGLVLSSVVFVVGSFIAWYLWTQMARPNVFHVPAYDPPAGTVLLGFLAIAFLAGCAFAVRRSGPVRSARRSVPPWVAALAALLLGFPWYLLMVVVFAPGVTLALWIPMALACAWGALAFVVVRWLSAGAAWDDPHRWAISLGALLVCMIAGFLGAASWSRLDTIAKAIMNVAAVAGMLVLRSRIVRRQEAGRRNESVTPGSRNVPRRSTAASTLS